MKLEAFFGCASPYTYFAFERVQALAAEFGVAIEWRRVLGRAVSNAINPGVEFAKAASGRPQAKTDYLLKDMQVWSRLTGFDIDFPPRGHSVNAVKARRACVVLEPQGRLVAFARAAFAANFTHQRPISDDAVLADLARDTGVDPHWSLHEIAKPYVKYRLRANVNEAIVRAAFGSPTFFLDRDDVYFGQERLPLLRHAMERRRDATTAQSLRR